MKRLAGGQDVRGDSEPWFGTLVRIGQIGAERNATNSTNSAPDQPAARQENVSLSNTSSNGDNSTDSTLDIINYNNALNALNAETELILNNFETESGRPFCGSTLISDRYVITTASCVKDLRPDQFLVILNLYSLKDGRDMIKVRPDKVIIHPDYDEQADLNNLALIRLRRTIEFRFDLNVVPLCLPQPTVESKERQLDYYPGVLYTLGYGRLYNTSIAGGPLANSLTNLANSLTGHATANPQPPKEFPNRLQIVYLRQDFLWCFLFYSSKFMENRLCTADNRIIHLTVRDVCQKGWSFVSVRFLSLRTVSLANTSLRIRSAHKATSLSLSCSPCANLLFPSKIPEVRWSGSTRQWPPKR